MEQLYQCFVASFDANPNHRKAAELELRELEKHDGMLASVLQIVANGEAEMSARQAAAIYLKNRVRRMWDVKRVPEGSAASSNSVHIRANDRSALRGAVLPTLVQVPQPLRVHVASALGSMVACDFPKEWPDLMDRIGELVGSSEQAAVYGGIRALLEVVRAYRWRDEESLLEPIASATFPRILATGKSILESAGSSSPEAGEIVYAILKVYKTSMVSQLTPHQQSNESIVPWGTFLLAVVQHQVDPAQLPDDEEEREASPWWRAKKWAFFSLNKLFSRFGNPSQLPSNLTKYKPFAERFVTSFAPEILKVYLRLTEANIAGTWLSRKAVHFIFMYYTECIKPKSTWVLLKPHVNTLVQQFVFPRMCYGQADEEQWDLDEVDFIRSHLDPIEEYGTPASSAGTFLQTVCAKRTESCFMAQLEFITSVMQGFPASRSAREKDGALNMTRALDMTMLKHPKVGDMLEGFFVAYVIPELGSADRFLRFRSTDLIRTFSAQMRWRDQKNLESAFRGVMTCLADSQLPVRVQAAAALGALIEHDDVHAAMAPNAGRLMQELLKLSDETDLDVLSGTTSKIVDSFSEELLPFSVQFCTHLRDTYMRLLNEHLAGANVEEDPDQIDFNQNQEDKLFAAVASLQTMYQVLSAAEGKPEMQAELEQVILPLVAYTLEKECVDLYDDCLDLTDMLTFNQKRISDGMWSIFTLIHKAFKSSGIDYLSEMLPTLDNIVSYGKDTMAQNAEYRHMIIDIFQTAMTSEHLGAVDHLAALKLADVILLLLKGSIDEAVPSMLATVLPRVDPSQAATSASERKWATLVTLDAFCYNPVLALQVLQSHNAADTFLRTVCADAASFKRVHDRKVFVVALCGLLALPAGQLPAGVQTLLPQMLEAVVDVLRGLPEAIQKRKEEIEAFEDLEESFADDDDELDEDVSASFVSTAGDEDVLDEDNEYLELLAKEGARLRAQAAGIEAGDASADFEELEDEDEEEEEMGFESPMDPVPVFELFRSIAPSIQALAQAAPPALQAKLQEVAAMPDVAVPSPSAVPILG